MRDKNFCVKSYQVRPHVLLTGPAESRVIEIDRTEYNKPRNLCPYRCCYTGNFACTLQRYAVARHVEDETVRVTHHASQLVLQ